MNVAALVCFILLTLTALAPAPALAQNPIPFQHIVLIIQENRTPDNLFGAAPSYTHCGANYTFESGVDIQDGGKDQHNNERCLVSLPLGTCWDINHHNSDWENQAQVSLQNGVPVASMLGACSNGAVAEMQGCSAPPDCAAYSYVQKSDVQPYFDIATNYGFANYMFATNEGPSFPAHQFLLSGTSAPASPGGQNYLDFVAENPASFLTAGCPYLNQSQGDASLVDYFANPLQLQLPSCYDHQTLVDLLDNHLPARINWRYYTPTPGVIWTAINAISHLCYKHNMPGDPCDSDDWNANVVWPGKFSAYDVGSVPVLEDIGNCQLQQMSWVVPDERWSDHAGFNSFGGPSYVADIVDAIGNSPCTDTINGVSYNYWKDTAIFIVWDDWGGWYDHVAPPSSMILRKFAEGDPQDCPDPTQVWGCGYTYGFRVPLLVVSAYTPAHYVSGACTDNCPNLTYPYIHDFGSILAFIEYNFGLGNIVPAPGFYADYNAPDNGQRLGGDGHVSLSDFFQGQYRDFVTIQPVTGMGAGYFTGYFANPANQGQAPMGPDGDDAD